MVACMLVLRVLTGTPTLPELFEDQAIALVPGSGFSLVLDRVQFAAKPLLFVGLAFLPVPVGAGLGWLYARAWPRSRWLDRASTASGIAYGFILWIVLELAVALWSDGMAAALASAAPLLASAETFGVSLVGLARLLEVSTNQQSVDRTRRVVVFSGLTGGALVLTGGGLARLLALNTEQPTSAADLREASAEADSTPMAEAAAPISSASASASIPAGVAEEVTPTDHFYVVSKNFNDPHVGLDRWSLEVAGLVARPRQISYDEILSFPTESQYTTLECISNTLGGKLMSNAHWTGVPLSQLLANIGMQPAATAVVFRSADNYYESFPLELASSRGVLLAHTMNGAPLPDKHGFPLRLILPGPYGMKNPKWIVKLELVADRIDGYWVRRGWDREALVQTVARIDTPADNANVAGPRLEVGGVAFAGRRGISRVEASLDGGATWREARLKPPLGSDTWVQWSADWDDVAPGLHKLQARATDGTGALQPPDEHDPFPRGATGYHHATIEVRGET
jgi:DMSO/TMAO reductase YedYZ molybdopterin-dependent catalytic subunit